MHQIRLLGDEAQVEPHFGPFRDSAVLNEVHGLRRTYHSSEIIMNTPD
jgi:hypothetical protein